MPDINSTVIPSISLVIDLVHQHFIRNLKGQYAKMEIHEKLLNLKARAILSQEAFAIKIEKSKQVILKWEGIQINSDIYNISKLREIYTASTDCLLLVHENHTEDKSIRNLLKLRKFLRSLCGTALFCVLLVTILIF